MYVYMYVSFVLQTDCSFLTTLHEAYVKSLHQELIFRGDKSWPWAAVCLKMSESWPSSPLLNLLPLTYHSFTQPALTQ